MGDRNGISIKKLPLGGEKNFYELGLTIVHPFFGEIKRFNMLYDNYWSKYPDKIKDKLRIIIVDDHGTPCIHDLMKGKTCDFNLTILRINEDLKHNTPGALNLGSVETKTDYMFHLDSDCTLEPDMMDKVMQIDPLPNYIYRFRRNRITDNPQRKRNTRYLPCAHILHKNIFTTVKGFDEDFTGARSKGYGFFDNHFDWKVREAGFCRAVISNIIVTEYMESLNTEGQETGPLGVGVHRTSVEENINRRIYERKVKNIALNNPKILRFTYKKVYENERTV